MRGLQAFQLAAPAQSALYVSAAAHLEAVVGSNRLSLIVFVAVLLGLVALGWNDWSSRGYVDREAMLGTWTDEAGPPGNSIRFYLVPQDIPGVSYATAYEGYATLDQFLGFETTQGRWNYGGWDPLVLNLWVGNRMWFVAIVKRNDNHILVRFGDDPEVMMNPNAINHPETKQLKRID